ncbi:MAG: hypothetical protein CMA65_05285 [Euryarchaeota archaeon]|jgi:hypothetical protein|nr:hypothetical protein [Euryarchaeota archaeon]|tara:strand:- start:830 stop:1069 length:240 start_codon:yes stop_codon:yes gene_type:complete
MSEEHMTLLGRDETKGKIYPLFIERILLISVVVLTVVYGGNIADHFSSSWVGFTIGYIMFPMALLAVIEMIGRFIQSQQ